VLRRAKTRDKRRIGNGPDKPALAECAMSLASALLLGCQTRGELESRTDDELSTPTSRHDETDNARTFILAERK
jgi:hypothetical protein